MATSSRQQPTWQQPTPGDSTLPPLKIFNSLTRNKSPFIPTDSTGKIVTWYACGPTVYDDAHLGHARTYVTSDIIRRIVRDYFGFKVRYVMNITDVDDKIILRARQQFLLERFKKEKGDDKKTYKKALSAYVKKNLRDLAEDASPAAVHTIISNTYADLLERNTTDDNEAKNKMHAKTAIAAARALTAIEAETDVKVATEEDSKDLDDIVMPYLDAEEGSSVDAKDHSIFTRLTKKHEKRFTDDMHALDVQDPDDITRVTEYVPQIVEFVSKIEKNGFAYRTSTGVYFDVEAFEKANNHYARLEPWNRNDTALQADGEGAITGKQKGDPEKKSNADFALWKVSKPGEPSWSSPWGEGRPGWHIECSAMASAVLGRQMDIHSGGIDLAFPHHDNELAQSEAYWTDGKKEHQWVNYFIHMGHLSIAGAKMSKSLKNFTTIREALDQEIWTSRSLRIVILLGGWRDGIEITDKLVKEGNAWEDKLNNFFLKAKDVNTSTAEQLGELTLESRLLLQPKQLPKDGVDLNTYTTTSLSLEAELEKVKSNVYLALCNSFSTSIVMAQISNLITAYYSAQPEPSPSTTLQIARWITAIVNTLGLNGVTTPSDPTIGWSGLDIDPAARPVLTAIATVRDDFRTRARSAEGFTAPDLTTTIDEITHHLSNTSPDAPFVDTLRDIRTDLKTLRFSPPPELSKSMLKFSDYIRDTALWSKGIYLEDRDNAPALLRPVTRALLTSRAEKDEREAAKIAAKSQREKEAAEKAEKGRLDPREMFRTTEWGEWDADGVPIKDKEGVEVPKSKWKKMRKEWERQARAHEAWVAAQGKGGVA